jgi:hypothetical protein
MIVNVFSEAVVHIPADAFVFEDVVSGFSACGSGINKSK